MVNVAIRKSPRSLELLANQLKALGDQTRLEILIQVANSSEAEACVCDITPATGLSQGTVSHHLRLLQEAELLEREQRGKWAYFSLTTEGHEILRKLGIAI